MTKLIFTPLLFLIFIDNLIGQFECGTDHIHNHRMANDPEYKKNIEKTESEIFNIIQNREKSGLRSEEVYTIPIVVHVIHLGEPVGTGTNISDQKIYDAIQGLNDRWKNVIGDGVNMGFEFCLANRNPNNQPTLGINRLNGSGINNYSLSGITVDGACGASETEIKDLSKWPVKDYYNIWVVNKICGAAGYANYPNGDPYDGTVIDHRDMDLNVAYTLPHEVGHGFNLIHTFESPNSNCPPNNNCLQDGDRVCDTPPHRLSNCGTTNPCTSSGIWDNSRRNYMSYCGIGSRFTLGQKERSRAAAMASIRRPLLTSLGCLAPLENDISIIKINEPAIKTIYIDNCPGKDSIHVNVRIQNVGLDDINTIKFNIFINGNLLTPITWDGNVVNNEIINVDLLKIKIDTGLLNITIVADSVNNKLDEYNPNNSIEFSCTVKRINTIKLENEVTNTTCNGLNNGSILLKPSKHVSIIEDFESEYDWNLVNSDYANLWIIGDKPGDSSNKSIYISDDSTTYKYNPIYRSEPYFYKQFYIPSNSYKINLSFEIRVKGISSNNSFGGVLVYAIPDSIDYISDDYRITFLFNVDNFSTLRYDISNIISKGTSNKIIFRWLNWGTNGNQPPAAIDNIEISYDLPDAGPFSFEWTGPINSAEQNLINVPSGNYNVIVTDTLGCVNEKSIIINAPPVLNVASEVINNLCFGEAEGSINVTPLNGVYPFNYSWSNGIKNDTIANLFSDSYYLTISDRSTIIDQLPTAASCTPNSTSPGFNIGIYNVNLNSINHPSLSAQIENYRNFTHIKTYLHQDDESFLTVQTGPDYEERVLAWIDFNNNGIFEGSELIMNSANSLPNRLHRNKFSIPQNAIKYTPLRLRVGSDISDITSSLNTFKGPCNNSRFGQIEDYTIIIGYPACSIYSFELLEPSPVEAKLSLNNSQILCEGDSIELSVTEGYSYLWSTLDTTQTISIHESDDYFVMVTDSNGCTAISDTISVLVHALPDASLIIDGNLSFCMGDSTTISCNESFSYLWNSGETSKEIIVKNSGNYQVTVTDSFGCSAISDPIQIVVHNLPQVEITPSTETTFCEGDSVTLFSSPAESYLWSNTETTQNITVHNSGHYSLIITDNNNCHAESPPINVVVNELPIPIISTNDPTNFCEGDSIILLSSNAASYIWNTNETTKSIIVSESGDYFVMVTDTNGCQGISTTLNVIETDNPIANISTSRSPIMCQGDSITLTAENAESYLWSNGDITKSIITNTEGEYSVTVTNSVGCISVSAPITVILNPLPLANIDINGETSFCKGGTVNLIASDAITYTWSNSATTQNINVDTSGNYNVTITDLNGCSVSSPPVHITVHSLPEVSIMPDGPTSFCQNKSVHLSSNDAESYLWNTNATTQTVEVLSSGNYFVTVTDENGCTGFSSLTVTVHPLPSDAIILSGPVSFCAGDSVNIMATIGANYQWNTEETSQSIDVFTGGDYVVTVTDENGCTSISLPISISVNPLPIVVIVPDGPTSFCQENSVHLSANEAESYLWSSGATTQTIEVSSSGDYIVTLTDENGCASFSSIGVTVYPLPSSTIILSNFTTFCEGGSVTLTSAFFPHYQWSTGEISESIIVYSSGEYAVTVTDINGCTAISPSIPITVHPLPVAVILPDGPTTFCQGGSVNLTASEAQSYEWSSGQTTKSVDVTSPGVYAVTITDINGCTAISPEIIIDVKSLLTPAIAITSSAIVLCAGDNITFTSSATNGGPLPTYQWFVNGALQAETGPAFSSTTLKNNDQILCQMHSNAECLSQPSAQSNTIFVAVNPLLTPEVSINTSSTSILSCQSVTFTAIPTHGGITPTYEWFLNGNQVGSTSTFTSTELINDDQISCLMTSTATCKSSPFAESNIITMSVSPLPQPSIEVSGDTISSANYKDTQYEYNWYFNGNEISASPFILCTQYGSGSYYLVINYNGCTDTSNTMDIVCTVPTKDIDNQNYFIVYPNPTNSILNIYSKNISIGEFRIVAYNLLGQKLEEQRISGLNDKFITQFDMSGYVNGIYTIAVYSDKHKQVFKVFKIE